MEKLNKSKGIDEVNTEIAEIEKIQKENAVNLEKNKEAMKVMLQTLIDVGAPQEEIEKIRQSMGVKSEENKTFKSGTTVEFDEDGSLKEINQEKNAEAEKEDNKLEDAEKNAEQQEVPPSMVSPEKIENLEEVLSNIEKGRTEKLENGPLSSRFKNGVINGIEKWENFGKGEAGIKGFGKRFTKMTVNLALIGAISSISVDQLSKAGIGTATALSGSATSYLVRKMGIGLGIGGIMEVGGGKVKIPDKVKKWMPLIMGAGSVGVATIATGGLAGVAAGLSAGAGWGASKLVKGWFSNEKILKREEEAKQKLIEKAKAETIKYNLEEIEKEYTKILKKYENQRIWGKLLDGATKLSVGALVSGISLEASGMSRDIIHHQATIENIKQSEHVQHNNVEIKTEAKDIIHLKGEAQIQHEKDLKHIADLKEQHLKHVSHMKELHDNQEKEKIETNMQNIIVHKGEGIESSFIRQIQNNHELAKELGYKGDLNDAKALHEFAGREAHILAIKEGYVDNNGNEVRVAEANKIGYEIKMENGHAVVTERSVDGKIIGTHHEGDKFEENPNKGEYIKHHDIKTEHDTNTHISDKYKLPEQTSPIPGEHVNNIDNEKSELINNKHKLPQQVDPTTGRPISNGVRGAHNTEFKNNSNEINLSTEQLHQVHQVYTQNIHHLFRTEKGMETWDFLKKNVSADRLIHIGKTEEVLDEYKPLVAFMNKLEKVTGLHPDAYDPILGTYAEAIPYFINRAMEEAERMGRLHEVEL